jgi:hypothetical protein
MPTRTLKSSRQALPTRTIYDPIGFNPAEVLPLNLHRYADYARFFLHVLYSQRQFKEIKDEFVPLKAAYLRRFFPSNTVYKCERRSKNVARGGDRWSVRKRSAPGLLPCIADTMEGYFPFTGPRMEARGCSPTWRNGLKSAVASWSTAKASGPFAVSSTSTGIRYRKSSGTLSRPGTAAQAHGHDPSSIPSCP